MAIKFKYDATGVVIPKDKAQQKFGEQLVLNQQKYANDTRQNVFDQQKQGMQNRFQANLQENQLTAQAKLQEVRGQQALGELNAQQTFGVQNRDAAHAVKMQDVNNQMDLNVFNAQVNNATNMANDALKNPNTPPAVKQKIQALITGKGAVNSTGWSAEQKQQYLDNYMKEMSGHLQGVPPEDPAHVTANKAMTYYNPKTRGWIDKATADQLPPNEVQSYLNGHLMPGPPQQATAGSYYSDPKNDNVYKQDYANAKKEIQTEIQDDGKTMSPEALHAEASRRMELDYNNKQKNIAAWQAQGMPAMSPAAPGQAPVTPGMTPAPVGAPPPAVPVPNEQAITDALGLTANATQGEPAAPQAVPPVQEGQPVPPVGQPAAAAQAAPLPVATGGIVDQEGRRWSPDGKLLPALPPPPQGVHGVSEGLLADIAADQTWRPGQPTPTTPPAVAAPDPTGSPTIPLPNPKAIEDTLGLPRVPANPMQVTQEKSPIDTGLALAPGHPDYKAPPTLTGQTDVRGYAIMSDGSKVDPRDSAAMKSGGRVQQGDLKLTHPDGSKKEPSANTRLEAGATQDPNSIHSMIGETIKAFESGTPKQKATLRQKMKSSDNLDNLVNQAKSGNADAVKAMKSLGASLSPTDMVADAIINSKKDGKGAVAELNDLKKSGKLDDASYTSAIINNSGKTAKQNYEETLKNLPYKKGLGRLSVDNREKRMEKSTLNAIWDEMGMYDSNPVTRAFQKEPTMDDVIKHAVIKGKMSRKDAEEWVYNQLLSRNYAENVQQNFEQSLTKDGAANRDKKQDMKRDAWTPTK